MSMCRFASRRSSTTRWCRRAAQIAADLHPLLQTVLDATPKKGVQILISEMTGRPFRETEFQHTFAYDRARLQIRKELQFRDLRRTGAVTLARIGVPIQKIAALGGWEINTTTEILKTYIPLDEHMATSAVHAWAAASTG